MPRKQSIRNVDSLGRRQLPKSQRSRRSPEEKEQLRKELDPTIGEDGEVIVSEDAPESLWEKGNAPLDPKTGKRKRGRPPLTAAEKERRRIERDSVTIIEVDPETGEEREVRKVLTPEEKKEWARQRAGSEATRGGSRIGKRPAANYNSARLESRKQNYKICGVMSRRLARPCERPAGSGTGHFGYGPCYLHGGNAENHVKSAVRTMIDESLAEGAGFGVGLPVDIDPTDALLELVKMTAGYVRWLNRRVAALENMEEKNYISGVSEVSVYIRALGDYSDRLAKFSKMALDAGVEERMVRVAEAQGDMMAIMLVELLDALELTPDQAARAPELVRAALGSLGSGGAVEATLVDES